MKKRMRLLSVAVVLAGVFSLAVHGVGGEEAAQPPQGQAAINPDEAFRLMAGEAEKGNGAAMLTLGTMYERGIGTPRNFTKALEWYRKAASSNMAEGYYNVGVAFEIGMGIAGNAAEAFNNFEKSAELGLPQGLYKLATLYFSGTGTGKNEAWGIELLKRAVAAGHMTAANDLGVIHFEGVYNQPKDTDKAFEMFSQSAEMGNPEAMKNLAVFYRDGIGRAADPAQEMKWYGLARVAGFPPAAIDPVIEKLKTGMTEEQIKKIEAEMTAWVTEFQKRQQAAAAAAQQKK